MAMKFTIRTWLWTCVPLGLLFAILQRPLRDADFLRGLMTPWYWLLWLCYAEESIPTGAGNNDVFGAGLLVGVLFEIGLGVAAVFAVVDVLVVYSERKSER